MIVYHGSVLKIEKPNTAFSKKFLDFGSGFYVTSYKDQAERWAKRKSIRLRRSPVVNIYEMDISDNNINILKFENENEDWLDFVCDCRNGSKSYKNYDVIIGKVADDDVFKTIDMYTRGIWDKSKVLEELRFYKMNDQICFVNQAVLDTALNYVGSYKVGE